VIKDILIKFIREKLIIWDDGEPDIAWLDKDLDGLKKQYIDSIKEKLSCIKDCIEKIIESPKDDYWQKFELNIHKISGTSSCKRFKIIGSSDAIGDCSMASIA